MAQKAIQMNQIRQVKQLRDDGVPIKEIVRRLGISRKTVKKYLRKMQIFDAVNTPANTVSEKELLAIVCTSDTTVVRGKRFEALLNHFAAAKDELRRTGVNKQILWLQYSQESGDGYGYSQYCYHFRKYLKDTDPAFHWEYSPGEFIQCDFAGKKLSYVNSNTGEVITCEIFIAVLPFSGLIFCIAVPSQKIPDFAKCINALVKYLGGVARTFVVDNFKTAVIRADKFEPIFNDLCNQLGEHYQTTFSATRPASPTDKGMVEKAVSIVYTNVYAPLRNMVFHSLESLNQQISIHLEILNRKPYKNSTESRLDIFIRQELPTLKPLPSEPFQVKKGKQLTVQRNYAIQLSDNHHYYTVPYQFVGSKVWVSYDSRTVEVFFKNERIAFHVRSSTEPMFNRIHEHMPLNHQHMVEARGWTVDDLMQRAAKVGQYTEQTTQRVLHGSIYPEQNYRTVDTLLRLQITYGKDRLEAACRRASSIKRPTLRLIRNILKTGLDKQPLLFDENEQDKRLPKHDNIRGPSNYQ